MASLIVIYYIVSLCMLHKRLVQFETCIALGAFERSQYNVLSHVTLLLTRKHNHTGRTCEAFLLYVTSTCVVLNQRI